MHILHVVHQYPPDHIGGTELYTQALAQAQVQNGHQVTVFCRRRAEGKGWEERAEEEEVRIWQVQAGQPSPTRLFLDTFGAAPITRAFKHIIEEIRPDLVHIQHLMGLPANLVHLIQRKQIPYVITLHDYWWICPNAQLLTNYNQEVCSGPRAYADCALCALARIERPRLWPTIPPLMALLAWRNHLLRQILRRANHLIAPTPFVQQWYAKQGVPPQKISIIPHGIERPTLPKNQRREPNAPIRFAYIGGLSWQKGVHIVVEAFKKVRGAELWIAGDESFDPDYASRLREQASPNVQFLGQLPHAKVWETLAQADAVVVPSLWYETFALIAREAFAAGVPVVASRLGALTEAVRDGVDGLLVPPGDSPAWQAALQQLVDEPERLAHLRANVKPPMTLKEHTEHVESLYKQLVDRSS